MRKSILVLTIVLVILAIDQSLKFWIKTNFFYNEEMYIIGNWARLHFLENEGMAFGARFQDFPIIGDFIKPEWAKPMLTTFRIVAVGFIIYFVNQLIQKKAKSGLVYSMALILAGAIGNIIDSVFYGKIFSASDPFERNISEFLPQGGGYADWFHGKVVDMFYFPLINTTFPKWIPFVGGNHFEFFRPVFNVADSAISIGIFIILIFYRSYFVGQNPKNKKIDSNAEGEAVVVSEQPAQ